MKQETSESHNNIHPPQRMPSTTSTGQQDVQRLKIPNAVHQVTYQDTRPLAPRSFVYNALPTMGNSEISPTIILAIDDCSEIWHLSTVSHRCSNHEWQALIMSDRLYSQVTSSNHKWQALLTSDRLYSQMTGSTHEGQTHMSLQPRTNKLWGDPRSSTRLR